MPKQKVPPCNSNHVEYTRGKSKFCKLKRFTTSSISKKLDTIETLIKGMRFGGGGPPPPPPLQGGPRKEPIKISSANRKLAQKKQNMMANLMKAVAARRKKMN